MKQKTFREFTFCNADQIEVMVAIDVNNGNILDMYCYADNIPDFENPETGKSYTTKTIQSRKNPLFTSIINKKATLIRMLTIGDYLPLIDESDTEFNSDMETLNKCMAKYKTNLPDNLFY